VGAAERVGSPVRAMMPGQRLASFAFEVDLPLVDQEQQGGEVRQTGSSRALQH
jgi:hypothetical protein